MREHELIVGGESSGHLILLEHNTTGDALIAGLQVLATMVRRQQPLSGLASVYHAMPESHASVPLNGKSRPDPEAIAAICREAEAAGRVVIRPSGTEPIVRVMVQHESLRAAEALVRDLVERVAQL